jgi:hypothetical protein
VVDVTGAVIAVTGAVTSVTWGLDPALNVTGTGVRARGRRPWRGSSRGGHFRGLTCGASVRPRAVPRSPGANAIHGRRSRSTVRATRWTDSASRRRFCGLAGRAAPTSGRGIGGLPARSCRRFGAPTLCPRTCGTPNHACLSTPLGQDCLIGLHAAPGAKSHISPVGGNGFSTSRLGLEMGW